MLRRSIQNIVRRITVLCVAPAWVVTWDLTLHLVLPFWVTGLSVTVLCLCSFTLACRRPLFHDWNGSLLSTLTTNNCQQIYRILFDPVRFGGNYIKSNRRNIVNCAVLWDLDKNGEECLLKVTAQIVNRELVGAIYWMTWNDRTPRGPVGVQVTLTSAVTMRHDFDTSCPHSAVKKDLGREQKSDSTLQFCFAILFGCLFPFQFSKERMRPTFNHLYYTLPQLTYLWTVLRL